LWLYTALLIFRPADLAPALAAASRLTFAVAALTLLTFLVSQWRIEGRLTARPREVNIVLALCLAALLSVPWALSSSEAIATFSDSFIKAVLMFIVIVNAVRTEKRLLQLLHLVLAAGVFLAYGAIGAFRRGEFSVEGYRVKGNLGAALSDPNDTALFLVTMIPIALALMLAARGRVEKLIYGGAAAFMTAAIFVTYSRGGFLALAFAAAFLGWKMMRRAPLATGSFIAFALVAGALLMPSNYAERLGSISGGDTRGSASARSRLLERSVEVAAQNPIVGVGMGNFSSLSIRGQSTHNAYTQVAAEMGLPALLIYLTFLLTPLARLRRIERETAVVCHRKAYGRIHFLSLGLQASIIGFMIGSFFLSVAYYWFIYYLVGYAVCLGRIYETGPGRIVGSYEEQEPLPT
jgi:O-antigen ligase